MRRRDFITLFGGAAVWPLDARAQQPAMPVIGLLFLGRADNYPIVEAFRRGLGEAGYVENRNVTIEYRWADGHYERLSDLAADLVGRHVDIIAAIGTSSPGLAAKAASSTIPVVFQTGGDPVAEGLVASMNRPGGNVTGVSRMAITLNPKRLQILLDVVRKATAVGYLMHRDTQQADFMIEQIQRAAQSLGLRLDIAKVGAESELENAFAAFKQQGIDALLFENDPAIEPWTAKIVALTMERAIPSISNNRAFAAAGGLMSYDASLPDSMRQVGVYVGQILKGDKPADLPIQQPTKFDLVINLKTAKTLGLSIPQTLLATADEVVE
jgi:putative ABC transport system substrate-binding protein